MRIVILGVEPEESVVVALRAALPRANAICVTAEVPVAIDGAALVVLAPSAVARDDVVAVVDDLRRRLAGVPILAVGAEDRAALAVALLKAGASDYAVAGTEDVATCARGLLESASPRPPGDVAIPGLVGTSRAMVEVRALVRVAARAEAHVLIEGETGTGKEVVARAVHALGARAARPLRDRRLAAHPPLSDSESQCP
jgi:two-component system NtrC family response regulator